MKKNVIITLIFVLTLTTFLLTGLQLIHAAKPPLFELKNLKGDTYRLKDDLGEHVIVLDFWATWCKPCMRELPHINKLYDKFKDKGLKVYAISVDDAKSKSKIKPTVRRYKFTVPVLLDSDNTVVRKYSANASVPHLVIIGKDGEVVHEITGYKSGDEKVVEKILVELLGSGE